MRHPLKIGIIAAVVAVLLLGIVEISLARSENDFFQFCTTKAYGWPTPWKIDYCECNGLKTVYPAFNFSVNIGLILAGGLASLILFGGIAKILKISNFRR